jgi:DNA-directed RNA polymerase specialized sigma24 family protein
MFESPSHRPSLEQSTEWVYLHELENMSRWLTEGDEASPALRTATTTMDTFRGAEMVKRWIHTLNSFEVEQQFGLSGYSEILDHLIEGRRVRVTDTPDLAREVSARLVVLERLCALPDNYRCALLLKEGHGLSVERTAKVMGVSTASVRSILYRARQSLRTD